MSVKRIVIATVAVVSMAVAADVVSQLPASEYLDTEVSTNLPFQVGFATMSRIEMTVSLAASPTNCVEVSVGTDADGDGVLSHDEADHTFGYNCGQWFHRDAIADAVDTLTGGSVRDGIASRMFVLKRKRLNENWNLIKVVRRGVAEIGEVVLVDGRKPGFCVEVR